MFHFQLKEAKPVKISRKPGHIFLGNDTLRDLFEQKLERRTNVPQWLVSILLRHGKKDHGWKRLKDRGNRETSHENSCTQMYKDTCTDTLFLGVEIRITGKRNPPISSSTSSSFSSFSSSSSSSSYASCLSRASTYENYNFPDSRRKFRD